MSAQLKTAADTEVDMGGNMATKEASTAKLVLCFAGIFISYFIYGFLQESITKGKYGDEDKFTFTLALLFFQCIVNGTFAQIVMAVTRPARDTSPQRMYAAMSFSYIGAMICSFQALQYVSYPTQVLGKSVKPIPVMILGVIVAHKRYALRKYLFVLMIVAGVALFTFKDKKAGASGEDDQTFGVGGLLLLLSLLLDGMTGGIQDKIRAEYTTQTHRMMFFLNAWSVLYLGIALIVTGEGLAFTMFAIKHPFVLTNMFIFSICSAVGQHFIFLTVTTFGPLMCSIFTTTRKFFTILGSVLIFGHPMAGRQWAGTAFVFVGLVLDNLYGKEKKSAVVKK